MGGGRDWLQLQRRSSRHAGRDGESPGGDFPSLGGPTECRNSAVGGRQEYLSLLAGIHGELCAQVCGGWGPAGGWVLRNDSGTYSGDEVGDAGGRGQR